MRVYVSGCLLRRRRRNISRRRYPAPLKRYPAPLNKGNSKETTVQSTQETNFLALVDRCLRLHCFSEALQSDRFTIETPRQGHDYIAVCFIPRQPAGQKLAPEVNLRWSVCEVDPDVLDVLQRGREYHRALAMFWATFVVFPGTIEKREKIDEGLS